MIRDEILALCELSNDLFYHKIPEEKLSYYIKESLRLGREAGEAYSGKDILNLCEDNKIEIKYIKKSKKAYGVSFRAQVEMDKKHTKIWLYEGSIQELAKSSGYDGRKTLTYEEALKIHLCHEFFHYLEYTENEFVPEKLEKVVTLRVFNFTRKARIQRCSEIAANSFAKELLQLKELPNVYDYIYLINSGKISKEQFVHMIEGYESTIKKINL